MASSSASTVTTNPDGTTTIITTDGSPPRPAQEQMPPMAAFFIGMIFGAIVYWLIQRGNRARALHREAQAARLGSSDGRAETEVTALARRTATLERIITDPAHRVASEIDALR